MGACSSSPSPHLASTFNLSQTSLDLLDNFTSRLGVPPRTVEKLGKSFRTLNAGGGGSVRTEELLAALGAAGTEFNACAFSQLGGNKAASVDFAEFAVSVFGYCTLDWSGVVRFAFELFDGDGAGEMEVEEVGRLVCFVAGVKELDARASKIIRMMEKNGNGACLFFFFFLSPSLFLPPLLCYVLCSVIVLIIIVEYYVRRTSFLSPLLSPLLTQDNNRFLLFFSSSLLLFFSSSLLLFFSSALGVIPFAEFLKCNRRFPNLLFPAFALQSKLRQKVLGENVLDSEDSRGDAADGDDGDLSEERSGGRGGR